VHATGDQHDTAWSWVSAGRFNARSIDQLRPFHRSTNGSTKSPSSFFRSPIAMHEVADPQETSVNSANVDPAGLGVGSIVHRVPFQLSAKVRADCGTGALVGIGFWS
jgi:hypothetical protein